MFQNVARLAVENPANGIERAETNGPRLSRLEDREILRTDADGLRQLV